MLKNTLVRAAIAIGIAIGPMGASGVGMQVRLADGASKKPVVLELFTSEGCSSCPPADRLLQSLDENQPFSGADLIVLSEHVDYWNTGGWVDPFSSKIFSARQGRYAEQFGPDTIYTPQAVVDGQSEAVGGNLVKIREAVEAATRGQKVALTLSQLMLDGKRIKLHISSGDLPAAAGATTVYVALAENRVNSNVAHGENGGRSLTHVAVVRVLASVGTVKGGASFSKDVTLSMPAGVAPTGYRIVAFLQDDRSHKIVGAAHEQIRG